jgi:hypothetical protein
MNEYKAYSATFQQLLKLPSGFFLQEYPNRLPVALGPDAILFRNSAGLSGGL